MSLPGAFARNKKPIPDRSHDHEATLIGGDETSPTGFGVSKLAALNNLIDKLGDNPAVRALCGHRANMEYARDLIAEERAHWQDLHAHAVSDSERQLAAEELALLGQLESNING